MADKRKEVERMSPKIGRPTDAPKHERITVRIDEETKAALDEYCKRKNVDKAEAVRRGIKRLKTEK